MKAVIHIGMPKSGTSTIQAFLALNADAILAQGVLHDRFDHRYGSQFELPVMALASLGRTIKPEFERNLLGLHTVQDMRDYADNYASHLSKLLSTRAGQRIFVASSEHIYAWLNSVEQIRALDTFLSAHFSEVRYLLYLRSQEELVLSGYSEAIRRVHSHSLAKHLRNGGRINLREPVDRWVRAVGRDRLDLRILASDVLRQEDLLTDFCYFAGIDPTGLVRPGRVNAALSAEEIYIRRVLNRLLPRQNKSGDMHPLYRIALRGLLAIWRKRTPLRLSAEQRAKVRHVNAVENERLRKRFFPKRQRLF